jgi:aspartate kinase
VQSLGLRLWRTKRDLVASVGQSHSAWNSGNILNNHGIGATLVDLRGINDHAALMIDGRIRTAFARINYRASDIRCSTARHEKGCAACARREQGKVTIRRLAAVKTR